MDIIKLMKVRVLSAIVLVAVALMFTGVGELTRVPSGEKSCCDDCHKGQSQNPDRCSTPDCPVFVCLSMAVEPPLAPAVAFAGVPVHHSDPGLHLELLPQSIFHIPKPA